MTRTDIKIAGFGGQGVIMAGIILGKAASIFDRHFATMIQSFGPEARGSACSAQVVIDREPIAYPYIKSTSILAALNQEAYHLFIPSLHPDGILIFEQDMVKVDSHLSPGVRRFGVPATRIAEEVGRVIVQNVVMVGFFTAVTGLLTYDSVEQALRDSIPRGTEELNLTALRRGFEHGRNVLESQSAPVAASR